MYDNQLIERLRQGAIGLLDEWGLDSQTNVELLTISENATFRAKEPGSGRQIILRVYRPGYHTQQEIESELNWIIALRQERIVETPEPFVVKSGNHLTSFEMGGEQRFVVAFAFMTGVEPSQSENLNSGFEQLGAISARLHKHARSWKRPSSFVRKIWNFDTTVGIKPHWGDWRNAPKLTKDGEQLLEKICLELKHQLNVFGQGSDRFGLIHADLRLANLLVEGNRLGIIDFDDCGFGWFGYDFAAAISFFEHESIIAELEDSWIQGYRSVAPLSEEDVKMIPTFVMLRRLLLTAWIGSHAETPTAQDVIETHTDGTLSLADDFLSKY